MVSCAELGPVDRHNRELFANTHPSDWKNPTPANRYNMAVVGAGTTATRQLRSVIVCLLTICIAAGLCAAGDNWPRFRGPNGSGAADAKSASTIPVKWSDSDYNWNIKLPGTGHSSPVIWGDRIFLTCADEDTAKRIVCCVSAGDGKLLWKRQYKGQKHRIHRDNSFASSSPAADAERVYAYWADPDKVTLLALTHDGKDVWKRDLGKYESTYGCASSPILHDGMVIVNNENKIDSALIALDAKTGKDRWKTPRVTRKSPYTTPLVYTADGDKPQLIFANTASGLSGIDPVGGKVLWSLGRPLDQGVRQVCSLAIAGDLVLCTWGRGERDQCGLAIRPGTTDGKRKPKLVFRLEAPMYYSCTPVVSGKLIFACTDSGEMQCIDAATGRKLWTQKQQGGFYSSPVLVGNRVYYTTKKGVMVIVAAADKFKLLGRVPLGEKSYATPAVAGGVMYIRTFGHLMSLGGKGK